MAITSWRNMTAKPVVSWFAVVVLALAIPRASNAAPPPNEMCPVMPGEKAVPEFKVEHQGRTVYLCCAGCVQKFKANPGPYLANLPPGDGMPPATPAVNPETERAWWTGLLESFVTVSEFGNRHLTVILTVVGAWLALVVANRVHHRLTRDNTSPGRLARFLNPFTQRSAFLVLMLVGICVVLWREKELAREELATSQKAAVQQQAVAEKTQLTLSAKLLQWAWPQALHALPKGVRNTYYRGNDERSDKLFNGGNYRTATFHVTLTTDGKDVEPGANVGGQQLRVRFDITRAPNTAGNFFKADQMGSVFLCPIGEGAKEEIHPLIVTEADRRWTVTVPAGQPSATGYQRLTSVWAVCVGNPKTGLAGANVHYYIQAVLHLQDGILLPESTLWMIPVYPSPILHGPQADGQWFSDQPIPEIPDGKNATDPKLLGLPEAKGK
ncbi:MAG: hypothetical protein C0467_17115 [Planctomycetaceae bacterium]|nr:hypothetical protein [Planctomycetaceae bacterium]